MRQKQNSVAIRPAARSDLTQLVHLENMTFVDNDGKLSLRAFRYHIKHLKNKLYVAVVGQQVVGYLLVQVRNTNWRIYSLAIKQSSRGQGVGRALISYLMEQGKLANILCLTLEVRQSNQIATQLYLSLGFQVVSCIDQYYVDEAALKMRYDYGVVSQNE